jgi:hypothetical protein
MNEAAWLSELNTAGTELPSSLPNYDDNFPLAALVPCETAVTAMCFDIGRRHVPTKIPTIDLSHLAFTADNAALPFIGHGFAQFV